MTTTIEQLQTENATLKERIAELENRVARLLPYEELFEYMPFPSVIFRADGLLWAINRQNETLIHTSREMLVDTFNMFDDPEAHQKGYIASFEQALQGNVASMPPTLYDTAQAEIEGRKKDHAFWSETTYFPLYDNNDQVNYVVEINLDVSERMQAQERLNMFRTLVEHAPDGIGIMDSVGTIIYTNPALQTMLGYTEHELHHMHSKQLQLAEEETVLAACIEKVLAHDTWQGELTFVCKDTSTIPVHVVSFAIRNENGHIVSLMILVRNLSEQKRVEEERAAMKDQIIEAQRAALRELSTPLIPLSTNVLLMPLIGSIDSRRAQQVMEALLEGVGNYQASIAIVDITGVSVVDTQVANALVHTAQAVKLLGAEVVLTGIGPAMAQTLITLGTDLSGIVTHGTLQAGIEYALHTS